MLRKWYILAIVVLIYLPVSIDATVLHVAVPTLIQALQLSNAQMLWIIDIYPLMMAGLLLPMGALGTRIGYKKLMLAGAAVFGAGSLLAAFAPSAAVLIFSRIILAIGAAMILPAALACLRSTFLDENQRNFALGLWVVAGGGGAAFGPLIGGALLEHYHWGAVFLINIPIIGAVLAGGHFILPDQEMNAQKKINILDSALLTAAILLLIYALKAGLKAYSLNVLLIGLAGAALLYLFMQLQRRRAEPLLDLTLFQHTAVKTGFLICIFAMMALVGFELLISQELQFVYGLSPLQAGLFILPFMLAVSLSGLFAGALVNRFGVQAVSLWGLAAAAIALLGLAETSAMEQKHWAWFWMALLGISIESAFLAATSTIISASPVDKAAAAGAIESMAYELGTGFGVAVFGLLASFFYSAKANFRGLMPEQDYEIARHSIGETARMLKGADQNAASAVQALANQAFISAHQLVLQISSLTLLLLLLFVWLYGRQREAQ